jgi:glycosyltransferase involved in cell wall biosynthesis
MRVRNKSMRIVIDMQGAQTESRFRGIGRYTMSFAKALVLNGPQHEILLLCNGLFPQSIESIRGEFYGILPKENIHTWFSPFPINASSDANDWRRRASQIILQHYIEELKPDILHISSMFEGYFDDAVVAPNTASGKYLTSAILYDLIPLIYQDEYFSTNLGYQKFYMQQLDELVKTDILLAISEHTLQEATELLEMPEDKMRCIYGASDPSFRKIQIDADEKEELFKRLGIVGKHILYTGGADIRKNLTRLIRGYAALPDPIKAEYQLVLAGKMPDSVLHQLAAVARESHLIEDRVIFTGYINEDELLYLYNLCDMYIFPSWHEGFGLPVLEAMTCGAPVICSNNSSVIEVCGRQDATFNPLVEEEITAKLYEVINNDVFRADLIQYSLERSKLFSWEAVATSALEFFEKKHSQTEIKPIKSISEHEKRTQLYSMIAELKGSPGVKDLQQCAASISLNSFSDAVVKRLFVDVSELYSRDARTGIQRVTRSILLELLTHPPAGWMVHPVYATPNELGYRYATKLLNRILPGQHHESEAPIETRRGDIFLALDLQHQVVRAQEPYLKTLRNQGVEVYFVVYDLLPILRPTDFADGADLMHAEWLTTLCNFDGIVCISKAVADEFIVWATKVERLRKNFKVEWFHLGSDIDSSIPSMGIPHGADRVIEKLSEVPTFLMVGTLEPRKGYQQTLEAFELLWNEGVEVNLIIVGKKGWKTEALSEEILSHPKLGKRLFWLQGISDEYLDKLYQASSCLIAASYGEGFGLPLVEASAHGIPIIARDIPVFREVAENSAYFFNGLSPDDLRGALLQWLALKELNSIPDSSVLKRLTWGESAKDLMKGIGLK